MSQRKVEVVVEVSGGGEVVTRDVSERYLCDGDTLFIDQTVMPWQRALDDLKVRVAIRTLDGDPGLARAAAVEEVGTPEARGAA